MKTYGRKRAFQRCTQIDFDFGDICRLCFCTNGDRYNIFDTCSDVPISLKMMTCLKIEIQEGDGLPPEICCKCLKLLDAFYKFRKKCEEVNDKLHDISKKIKEVRPRGKLLLQKQINGKLSIVELLYEAGKETDNEVTLNDSRCIMDPLINEYENLDNSSLQEESSSQSENSIYNNNNTGLAVNNDPHEVAPIIMSNCVDKCESSENGITETHHFRENTSCNENISVDDVNIISTENCISNDGHEDSEPEPLSNYVNLQPLPPESERLIFMCEKCPKGFSKRMDLVRHSSAHDQQRGFECNQCEKWFPSKASFTRHERIHTGERPFCCSFCQKCFSQESILSRHMLTHTGEKPYKCDICEKTFTQREGLKMHMRRHDHSSLDMPQQYYCPLCKKGFCHKSGLSRHFVRHTGKTFNCSVCSRSFSDQSSLKRHIKRQHDNGS